MFMLVPLLGCEYTCHTVYMYSVGVWVHVPHCIQCWGVSTRATLYMSVEISSHYYKVANVVGASVSYFPLPQSLCSECGQKLSECELVMDKMEPVSRKLHLLNNQMNSLDVRTCFLHSFLLFNRMHACLSFENGNSKPNSSSITIKDS